MIVEIDAVGTRYESERNMYLEYKMAAWLHSSTRRLQNSVTNLEFIFHHLRHCGSSNLTNLEFIIHSSTTVQYCGTAVAAV